MLLYSEVMGIADGPTEVHKITLAKQVLRDYEAAPGLWPTGHIPALRERGTDVALLARGSEALAERWAFDTGAAGRASY